MKLKLNLPSLPNPAQRCAPTRPGPTQLVKSSALTLMAARPHRPVRIPPPIIVTRPILRGGKSYLRALRAAEMALWNANVKFPVVALVAVAAIVSPFVA
ncbi:MAG: hypothetical protein U1F83_04275 [Verrucomicrobiota bacterium]